MAWINSSGGSATGSPKKDSWLSPERLRVAQEPGRSERLGPEDKRAGFVQHNAIQKKIKYLSLMSHKGRGATRQVNVRFSPDDVSELRRCQELLGGLSQADTFRQLILFFLNKLPTLMKRSEPEKSGGKV